MYVEVEILLCGSFILIPSLSFYRAHIRRAAAEKETERREIGGAWIRKNDKLSRDDFFEKKMFEFSLISHQMWNSRE